MNDKVGVKLETYELTPAQIAMIGVMKEIGYGEITIKFQNGEPTNIMESKKSYRIEELVQQRRDAGK